MPVHARNCVRGILAASLLISLFFVDGQFLLKNIFNRKITLSTHYYPHVFSLRSTVGKDRFVACSTHQKTTGKVPPCPRYIIVAISFVICECFVFCWFSLNIKPQRLSNINKSQIQTRQKTLDLDFGYEVTKSSNDVHTDDSIYHSDQKLFVC